MSRVEEWLERAYITGWEDRSKSSQLMRDLFNLQFDLMGERNWTELDTLFTLGDVKKIHIAHCSAMLRGCSPARLVLPNWHGFLDKLLVHIHEIHEDPMLLVGLIDSKLRL